MITLSQLNSVMNKRDTEKYLQPLNDTMAKYGIDTLLRIQHFLAQLGHESAGLYYTKEIGGKNKRYAPYYGRGLIQLTWEYNYKSYGNDIGKDLVKNPDLVAELPLCVDVAGWFWERNGLNEWADKDDVVAITKKINGGTNGLADRKMYLERAKKYITELPAQAVNGKNNNDKTAKP